MKILLAGYTGNGRRREEGRDKKGGYRWKSSCLVGRQRLWPPAHPLVALNDLFDSFFCDLLYVVPIGVLAYRCFHIPCLWRDDLLESRLFLEQASIHTQICVFQQLLLHVRSQRCRLADAGLCLQFRPRI